MHKRDEQYLGCPSGGATVQWFDKCLGKEDTAETEEEVGGINCIPFVQAFQGGRVGAEYLLW